MCFDFIATGKDENTASFVIAVTIQFEHILFTALISGEDKPF